MKTLPLLALASLGLATSCNTPGYGRNDHWNTRSLGPSVSHALLSYDAERDGSYDDHQFRKKKAIQLTINRHLFHRNPENPFQPENRDFYKPRPSGLMWPWYYFHVESLVTGGIIYASGGAFLPIPVDSLLGTLSGDGDVEDEEDDEPRTFPSKQRSASYLNESIGLASR